jgi:quercetin dioxygenase-like cupin family protein
MRNEGVGLSLLLASSIWAKSPAPAPVVVVVRKSEAPAYEIAKGKGTARLYLNAGTASKAVALTVLTLEPGAQVPEHVHETSEEILYIERGTVMMTVDGVEVSAGPGDVVRIPANVKHSAKVDKEAMSAVQLYLPPGPEQRFTQGERVR